MKMPMKVDSHKVGDRYWLKHYMVEIISFALCMIVILALVHVMFRAWDKEVFNGETISSDIKR